MPPLVERVAQNITSRRLIPESGRLLVAVSGGVDSMALLALLHELAPTHGWKLVVAHFNHGLRGCASYADESFVRRAAERLGIPFRSRKSDVSRAAKRAGDSIEMAARYLRHRFLAATASRLRAPIVALAHHADDQVELFLLRLLRGAGSEGLGGMRWSSPSPVDAGITLIRPLLDVTKAELIEFARARRIAFREDASNSSSEFLRNRIRHDLLPRIERDYQPALRQILLRLTDTLAEDAEAVKQLARSWLDSNGAADFGELAVAVQRRAIIEQLLRAGVVPEFELVERLRRSGRAVSVARGGQVSLNHAGRLSIRGKVVPRSGFSKAAQRLDLLSAKGRVEFGGAEFFWDIVAGSGTRGLSGRMQGREQFDADKVGNQVTLRHWRAGDRFQPIGMLQPVKLQNLFTNAKIPPMTRRSAVVAEAANGMLFWVEGLRIGECFKLDTTTRRRLKWRWRRL